MPNISAMPSDNALAGSRISLPGPMIDSAPGCTATARRNIASTLKPNSPSASSVAPHSSSTDLITCTQVVAVIPPKNTSTTISTPTISSAVPYGSPNSSWISLPAPTICTTRYSTTIVSAFADVKSRIGRCAKRYATTSTNVNLPRLRSGSAIRNITNGQPTRKPIE